MHTVLFAAGNVPASQGVHREALGVADTVAFAQDVQAPASAAANVPGSQAKQAVWLAEKKPALHTMHSRAPPVA